MSSIMGHLGYSDVCWCSGAYVSSHQFAVALIPLHHLCHAGGGNASTAWQGGEGPCLSWAIWAAAVCCAVGHMSSHFYGSHLAWAGWLCYLR
jgi:hypothetical protein